MTKLMFAMLFLFSVCTIGACSAEPIVDQGKVMHACPDARLGVAWCQGWYDDSRG